MSSIAEGRPKRATAGNRMAKLLTGEETEKDEFYETAYGGFKETEGDNEYVEEKEAEDDAVDSDFDRDEEEPVAAEKKTNGTEKRPSEGGAGAEEPAAKKPKEAEGEEESPAVIETVDEPKTTDVADAAAAGEEATNGAKEKEAAATEGVGVEEPANEAVGEPNAN